MISKVLLLFGVLLIVTNLSVFAGSANKEHVHIKLHVPEILKKHTHVRTIYKHHYKPKSKPKHKETEHDRQDPSIRSGTLHSRYQTRPHWMDKPKPNANHQPSVHEDSQEPEILHRWQQNLEMLQPKKKSKKPEEFDYPAESEEDDESEYETVPVEYRVKPRLKKQPNPSHSHQHQKPKHYTTHHHRPSQKYQRPDYMVMDGSLNFGSTAHTERHEDIHAAQSLSQSHFKPPNLLKITEDDIRVKSPAKKHYSSSGDGSGNKWSAYQDTMVDAPHKIKLAYEWPAEEAVEMEENAFTSPLPIALSSVVSDDDDENEFMPFKSSFQIMQQRPSYASDSTQSDEYSSVFGLKPVPVHYHPTYTQRKNKKNVMSKLNTRIMNS